MRFALITTLFVALVAAVPERMMESDNEKRQLCGAVDGDIDPAPEGPMRHHAQATPPWRNQQPGLGTRSFMRKLSRLDAAHVEIAQSLFAYYTRQSPISTKVVTDRSSVIADRTMHGHGGQHATRQGLRTPADKKWAVLFLRL
ncbi:hypothetical protein V8F33_010254 [Rhypophila sp. PSN 637]